MANRQKLLSRARNSQAGWRARELQELYTAWGFRVEESARHTKYFHPNHPDLVAFVTRSSGEISKAYVGDAVALIEELIRRG
jgi:hypothetical protein